MNYVLIFIIAAVIAFLFTPVAKILAHKLGAIDVPGEARRIHKKPTPRMGGSAIYVAFVVTTLIFLNVDKTTIGIIIGGTILAVVGTVDDIKSLKPLTKLLFQVLAAIILVIFGVTIKSVSIPYASLNHGFLTVKYLGIPLTLLWVIGVTNAFNLIDGLDGLSCGIGFISSMTLFGVSIISNRQGAIALTVILAGSCLGFLPYNFNPASIFMGDTGSLFLGFVLSAISIQGATKSVAAVAVAVPILALAIPIYDTLFAMIRRKINNKPMFSADRGHLHHRLLDMGLTQKQAVLIMYTISIFLGAVSIFAMKLSNVKSYELLIFVCAIIISVGVEFGIFSSKSNKELPKELKKKNA